MKSIHIFILGSLLTIASGVQAAVYPPYIAMLEGKNLAFSSTSCTSAATKALKAAGFDRVTPQGETVFAAYKSGRDYQFKAAVKCLPEYDLVLVNIVAAQGGALSKARAVLASIRKYARAGSGSYSGGNSSSPAMCDNDSSSAEPAACDCDCPDVEPPVAAANTSMDCSDGPTLVRCLNSVPQTDINLAIDYLEKLKQ